MLTLIGHGYPGSYGAKAFASPTPVSSPLSHAPTSRVAVYIHSSAWPFHQIAELITATDVHRAWQHMKPGQAQFVVARTDPQLDDDILERGNFLAIVSGHTGFPVWAGPIVNIEEDRSKPFIRVSAMSVDSILEGRPNRQTVPTKGSAGQILRQLIVEGNAVNHSGINLYSTNEMGGHIEELDTAGQYVLPAITEAANRVDCEWWIDVVRTSAYIEATANFGFRRGFEDTADTVVLEEGFNLTEAVRVLDTQGLHQSVTVYGGTGPVSNRPATTRSTKSSPLSWAIGRNVEPASEAYNAAMNLPSTVRTERIIYRPQTSTRRDLSLEAQTALELPIGSSERFRLVVNEDVNWADIFIGNYIRVRFDDGGLGSVNRKVKVIGIQPDELAGECVLVVETPIR